MFSEFVAQSLPIIGPELVLAVGAMILLMVGTFMGERSSGFVLSLAVGLLIFATAWLVLFTPDSAVRSGDQCDLSTKSVVHRPSPIQERRTAKLLNWREVPSQLRTVQRSDRLN